MEKGEAYLRTKEVSSDSIKLLQSKFEKEPLAQAITDSVATLMWSLDAVISSAEEIIGEGLREEVLEMLKK